MGKRSPLVPSKALQLTLDYPIDLDGARCRATKDCDTFRSCGGKTKDKPLEMCCYTILDDGDNIVELRGSRCIYLL